MNEVKATMSPSSLLSLKEVVIDYKIKTNEQSWQTWTGRWGSRIGILEEWMFNPRDDACAKPPEPTAWFRETLTLRETKISLPSQHSKKLLGMRCVELGQLSEDQRLQRTTQGARLQNRQLPQGWGSSNVKKKKKGLFSLKVAPNRCFSVSDLHTWIKYRKSHDSPMSALDEKLWLKSNRY